MVLEMPSENRQCQGRGNMGGQPIPNYNLVNLISNFQVRSSASSKFSSGPWYEKVGHHCCTGSNLNKFKKDNSVHCVFMFQEDTFNPLTCRQKVQTKKIQYV